MQAIRRVATGHDSNGHSVVTGDEHVTVRQLALSPGFGAFDLWRTDSPVLPNEGLSGSEPGYFPGPGGVRFVTVVMPPDAPPPPGLDLEAAMREAHTNFPGMLDVMEPDNPGMHTTDTIDMGVVLSGRVVLETDGGATTLQAGDCFVQNGTRHAWRVPFDEPCMMAVVMLGARRG